MLGHSRSLGGLNMGSIVRAARARPSAPRRVRRQFDRHDHGQGTHQGAACLPADAFVEPYLFRGELHLDIISADANFILGVLHTAPTGDVVLSIKYDDPRPRTA